MREVAELSQRPVTGDDILNEVLRNLESGQFKVRHTTLLPCLFRVFLHPRDFDSLVAAMPFLKQEVRRALQDKLSELNRAGLGLRLGRRLGLEGGREPEYRILDGDWTVEFHPDVEDRLQPGDIEVDSELASAERPEFAGAMTRRITRRAAGGDATAEEAPAKPATGRIGDVYGYLRFEDSKGPQTYAISKNQVVIGRGGKSFWVDVKLETVPDVSREHCRIRRDPVTGRFFLKDVSQFGTTINGTAVPSSLETAGAERRDRNVELPLPHKARIGLAGALFLDFEAREAE
jgi:hypothetical protein